MSKSTRDYPLAETPDPGERKPYMSKKEYKSEMKQAKREHNIEAAKKGTLASERAQKVKDVVDIVGSVARTASDVVKPSLNVFVGKKNKGSNSNEM